MAEPGRHVIGIDLGTTFSAMGHLDRHGNLVTIRNIEGELTTPSVVLFEADGSVVVGRRALRACLIHPDRVATCVKREMGEKFCRQPIAGKRASPIHVSALILKKLKQDAEGQLGPIAGAVITVPAYFDEARRRATADAGAAAGLEVLDILNEPTAAALSYGFHSYLAGGGDVGDLAAAARTAAKPGTILVYDLGGGTFDVTVVRVEDQEFRVLATDGDVRLGGKDWDERIVNHAAEGFASAYGADPREDPYSHQELLLSAEEAKRDLSQRLSADVIVNHKGNRLVMRLTRQEFEEITCDLLFRTESRVLRVMEDAKLDFKDIHGVLLVGGSTRMPQVKSMLSRVTGMVPNESLSADEVVAHGAAIQAAIVAVTGKRTGASFATAGDPERIDLEAIGMAAEPASPDSTCTSAAAGPGGGVQPADDSQVLIYPPTGTPGRAGEDKPLDAAPAEFAPLRLDYDADVADALAEIRTINVNAHSLGVVAHSLRSRGERTSVLIPRGSPLPTSRAKAFGTVRPNQRAVRVRIVEGESPDPKACLLLGECVVSPLPQGLPKGSPVTVTFSYDNSGRLDVQAKDEASGAVAQTVIIRESALGQRQLAKAKRLIGDMVVS